jgi:hypothetical protein
MILTGVWYNKSVPTALRTVETLLYAPELYISYIAKDKYFL